MAAILNGDLRLSQLLDAHPETLDYIVSLNPHDFQRLRNPVLRRYMAARISLARIALMVGRPEPLLLADLQAVIDGAPPAAPPPPIRERLTLPPPDWLPPGPVPDVPWVDLRAIDDVGGDPFPPISLAVRQLPAGGVLGIRHRWEPQPLYDVWGKMHLAWYARPVDGDEWQVFVHRPPGIPAYPIKPSIGVEVGAVPPAEVGPRVVALAEQLAPGQALQVTGASPEVVGRLRTYVATHLPRADLQSSTEPTAGVTVRLPDVGVQPSA